MELAMPSAQPRLTTIEAGAWRSRGERSAACAPSTTMTAWPASSRALATARCSSGRPWMRTSCLGEPKREEAPAASTITCSAGSVGAGGAGEGLSAGGEGGMLNHPFAQPALFLNEKGLHVIHISI